MGVGMVTHGRGSGLTVTKEERPDGIEALWTSLLPLRCHGSLLLQQMLTTVAGLERMVVLFGFVF